MLRIFISHYIKSIIRSTKLDISLVFKILFAFSVIYLCLILVLMGANFAEILYQINPIVDPVILYNKLFFYLLAFDGLLRFFLQGSNIRCAKAYIDLQVMRDKIILYILGVNLLNVYNLFHILFIIPFAWVNILPEYGWSSFILYLISVLFSLVMLTYSTLLLKIVSYQNQLFALIPIICISSVVTLKHFWDINSWNPTSIFFNKILQGNIPYALFLILATVLIIWLCTILIKVNWYNFSNSKERANRFYDIRKSLFLKRFYNYYIILEVSLLLRNKRIWSIAIIPVYLIFLTYFVYLFKPVSNNNILFFWYICLSGVWGYSYFQFAFSLESGFFDFLMTSNFSFVKYLKIKYMLNVLLSILVILFVIPIIVRNNHNLHLILSALFYNIAIGYFIMLIAASHFRERMDLNRSLFFNYQGNDPPKIFLMSATIIIPTVIFIISNLLFSQTTGLLIINIVSLVSILNYNQWFKLITNQLAKIKYTN